MKIKNEIIYAALPIINELAEKPMRVSLVVKMLRLADDLRKECEFIDSQRHSIIEKYGKKDENGVLIVEDNNVSFDKENIELAQNDLNELSEIETEIIDRNITEEELLQSNIELTMGQFTILKNFLHKDKE